LCSKVHDPRDKSRVADLVWLATPQHGWIGFSCPSDTGLDEAGMSFESLDAVYLAVADFAEWDGSSSAKRERNDMMGMVCWLVALEASKAL
jgi:hypothetical protein